MSVSSQVAHISAVAVLTLVFGWAALAKIRRPAWWRGNLRSYRLPPNLHRLAFVAVPWAELGVAAGILVGPEPVAAGSAGLLLGCFSLALVRARLSQTGNLMGCACFGGTRRHDYRTLLLRNVALGVCAVVAWRTAGATTSPWPSAAPVLLVAALPPAAVLWTLLVVRSGRRWDTRPGPSHPVRSS